MDIATYGAQALLNWNLEVQSSAPTRPSLLALGLSTVAPNSTSGSEIGTASGYSRQTATFAAAAAGGSATNINAMTFGPFSSNVTLSGCQLWDTAAVTTGNMWWYGTLSTPQTIQAGGSAVLAAGALTISLS